MGNWCATSSESMVKMVFKVNRSLSGSYSTTTFQSPLPTTRIRSTCKVEKTGLSLELQDGAITNCTSVEERRLSLADNLVLIFLILASQGPSAKCDVLVRRPRPFASPWSFKPIVVSVRFS